MGHMASVRSMMGAGRVRESQGHVGVWFPSGLWVTCSHGVTHIQGDEVILGYGSCGVTAQGPTFGPQGRPVPSQDEMKPLQTLPPSSFYLNPESPIAPQGPSQTQHISPTDKLGHHRLLQSPAEAHIPL